MPIPSKIYRIGVNILARGIQAMMRANNIDGYFCIGAKNSFFEFQGMRMEYHFEEFGVAGNIDSGGNTENLTRGKLQTLIGSNSIFYDIGAHEGLFSIGVQKREPTTIVHAFEPKPSGLKANIVLNGVAVQVHETAVGDHVGHVSMSDGKRSSNHITGMDGSIPITTIDDLVSAGLPPPNFIKIDIEGFEYQALIGARATIEKYKPVIVTEINDCHFRYHNNFRPFLDFMVDRGYALHALRKGEFVSVVINAPSIGLSDLPVSDESNYWWLPVATDNVGIAKIAAAAN